MRASLVALSACLSLAAGAALAEEPATPPQAGDSAVHATAAVPAALQPVPAVTRDLIETARASGRHSILLRGLERTNLTVLLKTQPNLTLFAPTDEAFAALPPGVLDRLMMPENAELLQKVLIYHLINARVDGVTLKGAEGEARTVEGAPVRLDGRGDALKVGDATVVHADLQATNGVIHVVDKVLLPPDVPLGISPATPPAAAQPAPAATPAVSAPEAAPTAATQAPLAVQSPTTTAPAQTPAGETQP